MNSNSNVKKDHYWRYTAGDGDDYYWGFCDTVSNIYIYLYIYIY